MLAFSFLFGWNDAANLTPYFKTKISHVHVSESFCMWFCKCNGSFKPLKPNSNGKEMRRFAGSSSFNSQCKKIFTYKRL